MEADLVPSFTPYLARLDRTDHTGLRAYSNQLSSFVLYPRSKRHWKSLELELLY